MPIIDCSQNSKCWTQRYIREVNVDLSLAKNSSDLEAVRNFSALALRKTQLAIQNILEQKDYLDAVVAKRIIEGENV